MTPHGLAGLTAERRFWGIDSTKHRAEQRLERNVGVVFGVEYPSAARNEVVEDRAEKLEGEQQGLERASPLIG